MSGQKNDEPATSPSTPSDSSASRINLEATHTLARQRVLAALEAGQPIPGSPETNLPDDVEEYRRAISR